MSLVARIPPFVPLTERPEAGTSTVPAGQVRRITFVPFLPDGRCVLIDGPGLPRGEVLAGEDYRLDAVLRIPLETAGFRYQRFHPFGLDGDHLYAWIEGAPYRGERPHVRVALSYCPAEEAAERFIAAGDAPAAAVVLAAAASYQAQDEKSYYADSMRTLEPAYLRARTAQAGSGHGGDERSWRQARFHITEAVSADGTFLDVGCANGLLMESVAIWCAEKGVTVEPYGLDLAPGLVNLARRRLPQWAGRIWPGNAIDWLPPDGLRFDYVHILLDCVPARRRADLIRHHLMHTVQPATGRLLVSHYANDPDVGNPSAPDAVRALGFPVAAQTSGGTLPGRAPTPTAILDRKLPGAPVHDVQYCGE
jgi:2-polyprenyl-3-methyl-5-hydroxy-6-metoxy-1,4-benzoquinol methylase